MSKTFSIYPGEVLLTEFMQPHKLTANRLAEELHLEVSQINDVVQGKRIISADTALRLGKLFNIPAKFWLNLQNDYDLRNANTAELAKIKPLKSA